MAADHPDEARRGEMEWALDIIERIPIGVYVDDVETDLAPYSNPELVRLSGRSAEEWATDPTVFTQALHPDDADRVEAAWQATCERGEPFACEYRIVRPDGEVLHVVDHGRALTHTADGRPKLVVGYIQDVTADRLAQASAAHRANHDELTGLANRGAFAELLERSVLGSADAAGQTAVLFLDLDGFKLVNDSLGHTVGDELLRLISERLRRVTRQADMIARQSGDEFLVLLHAPASTDGDIRQIAEAMAGRIRRTLAEPFTLAAHEVTISSSVGISYAGVDGSTGRELLAAADRAMYREKAAGKGGTRRREMIGDPEAELDLVARIRRGLDSDEFTLHYQPIVRLMDGNVVGCEALIRWQRDGELLMPGAFLPAMERAGLMGVLTDHVVRHACRQQQAWLDEGLPLRVSVNSPPMMLVRSGAHSLLRMIQRHGGEPTLIQVEVTESAMQAENSDLEPALAELAAAGVGVSIDDFGTGYSSLSRLAELPVSTLKIDRAFIREVATNPRSAAIAKTIVALAASLGMQVVAEGVETDAQRAFLRRTGCGQAQGFLWSRAVPPADLARLARRRPAA